jgi:transcription elongation GreA/GreB family factor
MTTAILEKRVTKLEEDIRQLKAAGSLKEPDEENFNAKTQREINRALKEIEEGKGLSPLFSNARDAITWLKK